jgi:hypothetical protein
MAPLKQTLVLGFSRMDGSLLPDLKFYLWGRIKDGATEANTYSGLLQNGSSLPGLKFGLWVRIKDGSNVPARANEQRNQDF